MTDEAAARFLVSDDGRRLLDETAALPGDAPKRILALRKRGDMSPAVAALAVEVLDARRRARFRFPDADRLFFTAATLAQATSPTIAAFHARQLVPRGQHAANRTVADLGCGAGIDSIALAEAGATVIAIECDPLRLIFAHANAEARGVAERIRFVEGDVTTLEWEADVAFWDPARRESSGEGHRVSRHGDRYEPPLSFLETIKSRTRGGCLKLSPALPDDVLRSLGDEVLFVSENRECKEACVLWGEPAYEEQKVFAAHLLPEHLRVQTSDDMPCVAPAPGAYVFDPDPAVVRAHALESVCRTLPACLLSPDDTYLTADNMPPGFLRRRLVLPYRVLETLPYKPREVTARLKAQGIGRLVVKKHHYPKEPDAVARELGLTGRGGEEATLIIARQGKGFLAVICQPYSEPES